VSHTLAILGGAVAGAITAPLAVLLVLATFYKAPRPESWDFATPLLTVVALVVASVVGAVGGLRATDRFLDGRVAAGWTTVGVAAVIVLGMPAAILSLRHLPRRRRR